MTACRHVAQPGPCAVTGAGVGVRPRPRTRRSRGISTRACSASARACCELTRERRCRREGPWEMVVSTCGAGGRAVAEERVYATCAGSECRPVQAATLEHPHLLVLQQPLNIELLQDHLVCRRVPLVILPVATGHAHGGGRRGGGRRCAAEEAGRRRGVGQGRGSPRSLLLQNQLREGKGGEQ